MVKSETCYRAVFSEIMVLRVHWWDTVRATGHSCLVVLICVSATITGVRCKEHSINVNMAIKSCIYNNLLSKIRVRD